MIIGLSGYARSGKDTVAEVLIDKHDFRRVAFADKLRDVLYALNPIVSQDVRVCSEILREGWDPIVSTIYLQDVIDRVGWDGYKETKLGPEVRRLLQRLGTEAGRQTLWDSIWVDAAFAGVGKDEHIVITDCRFPNEAQAIKERGGFVWRVHRPGVVALNAHPSETSLDDWNFDYHINNNGTIDDLEWVIDRIFEP